MANIVIVSSADFIDIDYGVIPSRWHEKRLRKSFIEDVSIDPDHDEVFILCQNNVLRFIYTEVDTVDSVAPTSNQDLYDKLKVII